MAQFEELLGTISGFVWGPPLLILLVGTGIFLTVRLGVLQLRLLPYALKLVFTKNTDTTSKGDISHFQALSTAMAATVGTGNIVGVATAVILGGPGAVFWMWFSAFFGMATKYGEAVAKPTILPVPTVAAMAVGNAWKWLISPLEVVSEFLVKTNFKA